MTSIVKEDLKRYYIIDSGVESPDVSRKFHVILKNYGIHSLLVFRFGQWVDQRNFGTFLWPIKMVLVIVHRCLNKLMTKMYGIDIDPNSSIGKRFYIGHLGGIKIGRCRIGENCAVHQNVNIESIDENCFPCIGDNVWIGAHAKIRGNVTIGNNVTVAAGTEIFSDIEDSCLIMGKPPVKIRNYNNSHLLGTNKSIAPNNNQTRSC